MIKVPRFDGLKKMGEGLAQSTKSTGIFSKIKSSVDNFSGADRGGSGLHIRGASVGAHHFRPRDNDYDRALGRRDHPDLCELQKNVRTTKEHKIFECHRCVGHSRFIVDVRL